MPPEPKAPTRFTLALPQPVNRVCICGRQALSSGWCPRCERSYGDAAWSQVARKPKPQKPKKVKVHKIVGAKHESDQQAAGNEVRQAQSPHRRTRKAAPTAEGAPRCAVPARKPRERTPKPYRARHAGLSRGGNTTAWKQRAAAVRAIVVRELERDPDLTATALLATVEAETEYRFASLSSFRHVYVRDAKNRLRARKRLAMAEFDG